MVVCLGRGADLHMAQLMPLPLNISCSSKSRLVLPIWLQLTRVVLDKMQEGHKMVVCVCVCVVNCTRHQHTHTVNISQNSSHIQVSSCLFVMLS